nr:uncharacterized protein LOC123751011 [Procambarus clarkii]
MIGEYVCYGLVGGPPQAFLMWLGPLASLISNAMVISFRSMSTKLVSGKEKGRINAVMCALNSLMPMMGYAVYSPLYYNTVDTFPAAQFFFAASLNVIIMVTFILLQLMNHDTSDDTKDVEVGPKNESIYGLQKKFSDVSVKSNGHGETRLRRHSTQEPSTPSQLSNPRTNSKENTPSLRSLTQTHNSPSERHSQAPAVSGTRAATGIIAVCKHSQSPESSTVSADNLPGTVARRDTDRHENQATGCYSSKFSDAEITASEGTVESPLDSKTPRYSS